MAADQLQPSTVKKLVAGGICVFILVAIFAVYKTSLFGQADSRFQDELKKAYAEGMPTNPAQLRASLTIPARDNAADALHKAFTEYKTWIGTEDGKVLSKLFNRSSPPTISQIEAVASSVPSSQPVFDRLEAVVKFPKLLFDRQWELGPAVNFPEFADAKGSSELVGLRARLELNRGQVDQCLHDLQTSAKLCNLTSQEPVLIGMLVGSVMHARTCNILADIIKAHGNDAATLEKCREILNELPRSVDMSRIMGAEFVCGLEATKLLGKPTSESIFGNEAAFAKVSRFGPARQVFVLRYAEIMRKVFEDIKKDGDSVMAMKNTLQGIDQKLSSKADWTYSLAEMMSPVYSGVAIQLATERAQVNILKSSIDLLEIKIKTGAVPKTLPKADGQWQDPFVEKQLIYKPSKSGFLIYSLGPDGIDQGGAPKKKMSTTDYDIPFQYP